MPSHVVSRSCCFAVASSASLACMIFTFHLPPCSLSHTLDSKASRVTTGASDISPTTDWVSRSERSKSFHPSSLQCFFPTLLLHSCRITTMDWWLSEATATTSHQRFLLILQRFAERSRWAHSWERKVRKRLLSPDTKWDALEGQAVGFRNHPELQRGTAREAGCPRWLQ